MTNGTERANKGLDAAKRSQPDASGPCGLRIASFGEKVLRATNFVVWTGFAVGAVSGLVMVVKLEALAALTRLAYTSLELGLGLALFAGVVSLALRLAAGKQAGSQ